ncbi:MAG: DUF3450 domain-containing protein [Puniceicoccaceae bacterium]|nr:MAG: DUF3450 domain-containing protein [Puniceicoccaceae bacterium]
MPKRLVFLVPPLLVWPVLSGFLAAESPLDPVIQFQAETNEVSARSQQVVDTLSEETDRLLAEYRTVMRRVESLRTYNAQIERIIASQQKEIDSIHEQLDQLEVTNQEVVPLMLRMIDTLENFVRLDVPFLPGERSRRLEGLQEMMDRADVTNAEKFRRVLEAYQVEMEYGRTIEAYRDELNTGGRNRTVDFLRFGRVGLYYRTLDGDEIGVWNQEARRWETLPARYKLPIRSGLQIARRQMAPDLIQLPVPAPEVLRP